MTGVGRLVRVAPEGGTTACVGREWLRSDVRGLDLGRGVRPYFPYREA